MPENTSTNKNTIPSYNPNQPIPGYYNPYGVTNNSYVYNPDNPNISQPNPYYAQNTGYMKPSEEQIRAMKMYEIDRLIPSHEGHSLKGIEIRPKMLKFATQNTNETAFVLVRRHWITNFSWILRNIFYSLVPFFIGIFTSLLNIEEKLLTRTQSITLIAIYYSIIVTNIFRDFLDWYFDPYIVTNERIIHYEFKPFTSYEVMEADLINIEDVKEESAGFIAGIFNYGNVTIRTASENGTFLFEKVPNPTRVRDIISDLSRISKQINDRYS